MDSNIRFLQFTLELVTSQFQQEKFAAFELFRDWVFARARLWSEIVTKLYYFRQLPWHLLGLAHHRHEIASRTAQECLDLFDNPTSPGREHLQSRRFLEHGYKGQTDDDVALRPYVEQLAKGVSFKDLGPLKSWLGRLASIRVAERSVEGIHSLITKVYKRAAAASLAYVSIELRMKDIVKTLVAEPTVSLFELSK